MGSDTKRLKIEDPEQSLVSAMQKSSDHQHQLSQDCSRKSAPSGNMRALSGQSGQAGGKGIACQPMVKIISLTWKGDNEYESDVRWK